MFSISSFSPFVVSVCFILPHFMFVTCSISLFFHFDQPDRHNIIISMPRKKNKPVAPSTPIPWETRSRARGTTPIVAAAPPALPHVLEAVLAPSAEDNIAASGNLTQIVSEMSVKIRGRI